MIAETAIVYPGTVVGEDVQIHDYAVVGKQPALSPRSTAAREELSPLELGPGTIVSTGAVVFAGTRIGARVIVGDQACVRERCDVGDDAVIGRGALVENDTTIGALTKIQAEAYITAYSTLEEEVFIAPCVITTNDNFMGRTEKRTRCARGRRSDAARGSAEERCCCRGSRSARRRSSGRARSCSGTSRHVPSWSGTQHGRSVKCLTTSCWALSAARARRRMRRGAEPPPRTRRWRT